MSAICSYCTRLFMILSKKYEVRLFINYKLALKLGIGINNHRFLKIITYFKLKSKRKWQKKLPIKNLKIS